MLNYTRSLTSYSTIKLVDGVDVGDGGGDIYIMTECLSVCHEK